MEPVLHERNLETKTWDAYDPQTNSWKNTGRKVEAGHSSFVGPYGKNLGGGYRKSRRSSHKRSRKNSKKSKRVRHTRRKQTRRHRR